MMTLKEVMRRDRGAFLSMDEFAEELEISVAGETPATITGILEEDDSRENSFELGNGMIVFVSKLHVLTEDLPGRPKPGKDILLNGSPRQVLDTAEAGGILTITLERKSS